MEHGLKASWRKAGDVMVGKREVHVLDPDGYFLRFTQLIGEKPVEKKLLLNLDY